MVAWHFVNRLIVASILGTLLVGGGDGGFFCCLTICELPNGNFGVCNPCAEEDAPGFGQVGATILDLNFKGLPILPVAGDPDPKDMSVVKFKYPTDTFNEGFLGGLDKRLLMRAKKDGASHELFYDRDLWGDFQVSLRVAIDDTVEGLVDGASSGYLQVMEVPNNGGGDGALFSVRMSATWDEATQGLTISASDENGPLGDPITLPGTHDVQLDITWNSEGRFLSGSPMDGFGEGYGFFYQDKELRPEALFRSSFGASSLDRKGRMFFTWLSVRSAFMAAGQGEVEAGINAIQAVNRIEQAWLYADPDLFPNPELAKSLLEQGVQFMETAQNLLQTAEAEGNLHHSTQRKLAGKSLKRGVKKGGASTKLAGKLSDKGSTKTKSLYNKINRVRWAALLVQAQLFGFKSKSIDHYFATLNVDTTGF